MRHTGVTRKGFDCLKLQMCNPNIDISTSYLFIYLDPKITI